MASAAAVVARTRAQASHTEHLEDEDNNFDGKIPDLQFEANKYSNFWVGIQRSIYVLRHTPKIVGNTFSETKKKKIYDDDDTVFHPENKYKMRWDILICSLVVYSVILIPYRIGFNQTPTAGLSFFDYCIDAFFFLDILVNFNTSYLDEKSEEFVTDRSAIALHYVHFWFWVDLFSTVPLDDIVGAVSSAHSLSSIRAIRILRLVRLFKLYRLSTLSDTLEKYHISPSAVNLGTLILQIFFIGHIFACFWHFIALVRYPNNTVLGVHDDDGSVMQTWLHDFGFLDTSVATRYVASLYFIIVTMLTVGYGDIHATNKDERLFAIATMLTGGIVFGALISKVTILIDKRNPQAKAYKEKMDEIKAFLEDKAFSAELKKKTREAYSYYLNKKSSFGERAVFAELPERLRNKLVQQTYGDEIKKVKLFMQYPASFVVQLVIHSRPFQAKKDEVVFAEGDIANELIFVTAGHIKITIKTGNHETLVGYCMESDYFGDFEYYKNTIAVATYTAGRNCSFLAVKHSLLNKLMGSNFEAGRQFKREIKHRYDEFMKVVQLPVNLDEKKAPARRAVIKKRNSFSSGKRKTSLVKRHLAKNQLWVGGLIESDMTMIAHFSNTFRDADGTEGMETFHVLNKDSDGTLLLSNMTSGELLDMYIIHPKMHQKVYWDIFIGIWIIYSVLVVPVQIAFSVSPTASEESFDLFIDCLFFLDMLLCFRTAYEGEGGEDAYVVVPVEIVKTYLSGWFLVDLFSTVPFDMILEGAVSGSRSELKSTRLIKILRLFRLLKLARIFKLSRYLEELEEVSGVSPVMFDFLTLIVKVLAIGHFVACFWWWTTTLASSDTWYDEPSLDLGRASLGEQYIASLYYTFATMTTVGFGDISAVNTKERLINIFIILVVVAVFGYILANVSTLLNSFNPNNVRRSAKLTEITEYLNEKNTSKVLRSQVLSHFKHLFTLTSAFDEQEILSKLPQSIANRILLAQNDNRMKQIAVLNFIDNQSIRLYIFEKLTPVFFETDQYIMREGRPAEEIMFLVVGRAKAFKKLQHDAKSPVLKRKRKKTRNKNRGSTHLQIPSMHELSDMRNEYINIKPSTGRRGSGSVNFAMEDTRITDKLNSGRSSARSSHSSLQSEHTGGPFTTAENTHSGEFPPHDTVSTAPQTPIGIALNVLDILNTESHGAKLPPLLPPIQRDTAPSAPIVGALPVGSNNAAERVDTVKGGVDMTGEEEKDQEATFQMDQQQDIEQETEAKQEIEMPVSASQTDLTGGDIGSSELDQTSSAHITKKPRAVPAPLQRAPSVMSYKSRNSSADDLQRMLGKKRRGSGSRAPSVMSTTTGFTGTQGGSPETSDDEDNQNFGLHAKKDENFVPFHQWDMSHMEERRLKHIGRLFPGSFFGHVGLMEKTVHHASVRAIESCVVYTLSKAEIARMIRVEPTVAIKLQTALVQAIDHQSNTIGKVHMRRNRAQFLRSLKQTFHKQKMDNASKTAAFRMSLMSPVSSPKYGVTGTIARKGIGKVFNFDAPHKVAPMAAGDTSGKLTRFASPSPKISLMLSPRANNGRINSSFVTSAPPSRTASYKDIVGPSYASSQILDHVLSNKNVLYDSEEDERDIREESLQIVKAKRHQLRNPTLKSFKTPPRNAIRSAIHKVKSHFSGKQVAPLGGSGAANRGDGIRKTNSYTNFNFRLELPSAAAARRQSQSGAGLTDRDMRVTKLSSQFMKSWSHSDLATAVVDSQLMYRPSTYNNRNSNNNNRSHESMAAESAGESSWLGLTEELEGAAEGTFKRMRRRQSFPSLDHRTWREENTFQGVL